MRFPLRPTLCGLGLAAAFGLRVPSAAAGDAVGILVLKEHGVGSAAQAQPYVDKFVNAAAKLAGWSSAKGQYVTTRAAGETFIAAEKPHYGIFSLGAFLGLRGKYRLEPIGQVQVARLGGQQYFLISKTAGDIGVCKGKRLATDHADDPKFLEAVVSGGAFKLADFTLVTTTRPMQTIKKVVANEVECALVDDAQVAEMSHLDEAKDLKTIWSSAKLPPVVVVAFPTASATERSRVQQVFTRVCEGEGKQACAEVGLEAIKPASGAEYAAVVGAYGK